MAEKIKHWCIVEFSGQMNDAAELRHVGANGTALAKARIGVRSSSKVKGEWKSAWLNFQLTAWEEMSEKLTAIPAGSMVRVKGEMKAEEWVARGGEIKTTMVVNIEEIEILGSVAQKASPKAAGADDDGSAFGGGADYGKLPADETPF